MGSDPPGLIGPEFPEALADVWGWFCELSSARGSNGYGPSALRFSDLDAWARFSGLTLTRFERDTLLHLDRLYLEHSAKNAPKKKETS